MGSSAWDSKELDATEQLSFSICVIRPTTDALSFFFFRCTFFSLDIVVLNKQGLHHD